MQYRREVKRNAHTVGVTQDKYTAFISESSGICLFGGKSGSHYKELEVFCRSHNPACEHKTFAKRHGCLPRKARNSRRLTHSQYLHEHKSFDPNSGLLHWLHVVISNAKAFILGTYHGLHKESLQSYLDEYCFRFSRRFLGPALLQRLAFAIGTSARLN